MAEDEEQRQVSTEEQYPVPSEHVPVGEGVGRTLQSYPRPSPRIGRDAPWYMEASSG